MSKSIKNLHELKLNQALNLAKKKSKDGLIGEAKSIYQDILTRFPGNKRAKDALMSIDDTKLKSRDPSAAQLQSLISLYNKGEFQKALEQVEILIKNFPGSANLRNKHGILLNSLGQHNKSVEAFKKALELRGDYAEAYNNLGFTLHEQGKLVDSIEAYKHALAIKPNYAEAHHNLGNSFREQGKLKSALQAYEKALAINPGSAETHNSIGNVLQEQGKLEEAKKAYAIAVSIEPHYANAVHMLAALNGTTTKKAPEEYIEKFFDNFSNKFDRVLVNNLEYKLPNLVKDFLIQQNNKTTLGSVLDIGCGTGLLGAELRNHCSTLEGVDLSRKMLDVAKQKRVYDKLSLQAIEEYLSSAPLNFDYFIALDVFIYIGELTEVFRLIKNRNTKAGKLVFSTEHTVHHGYQLNPTGRYSHSKCYIEGLCKEFDYKLSHFDTINLRKENGVFLSGGLYVLEFNNTR